MRISSLVLLCTVSVYGDSYNVPNARERFALKTAIVREKLDAAVLPAMRKHRIDMWIVLDRENHPDPLHDQLGGGYSGVRAAFIFFDKGGNKPEKIYFGSHEQGADSVITQIYDVKQYYGYSKEGLTPLLREAVWSRKPKKIGVNISPTIPDADGLTVGLQKFLVDTIGPEYAKRIVPAELVVRDFRTHRTPLETKTFTQLLAWTSQWETDALSAATVKVGKTTGIDISWWLQDRARQLGLDGSGTPRIVRNGDLLPLSDPKITVEPGDIISIDGGLKYLMYETDIKRTVYVLKPGEKEPPQSIQKAWQETLKMANLYASKVVPGAIGHVIWESLAEETRNRGYQVAYPDSGATAASSTTPEIGVYGHSVGSVAHDVGARVATDWPFAYGDRVDFPETLGEWVSLEFHVSTRIPEWGNKTWYARFEENMQVGPHGAQYLIPRQEKLLLLQSEN